MSEHPWSPEEFKAHLMKLRARYHIHHPLHQAMSRGELSREQIQSWVANRFYYQITIPRKDAAILANSPDMAFRRRWIKRIIDHDGTEQTSGGIEAWLVLAEAVGLQRDRVLDLSMVVPGVKSAVDSYYQFARNALWQEAVCSSLTELFAPEIHRQRLQTWPLHYPWVDQVGLHYFQKRLAEVQTDVEHGLAITLDYFTTRVAQERAIEIVNFKLNVLWAMCDAISLNYSTEE
ncbi:MAG: pyrroloquinoline-quinone synthase PqqC [Pseudomonadota bacterium]|nr:pyrroloquinoline-quinone synthase PqqC [Pseudomonadota bacterium]